MGRVAVKITIRDLKKYDEVKPVAISSIIENITINNPHFIELYVDHMDSKNGKSCFVRRTDSVIKYVTDEDRERMAELRRKDRKALK